MSDHLIEGILRAEKILLPQQSPSTLYSFLAASDSEFFRFSIVIGDFEAAEFAQVFVEVLSRDEFEAAAEHGKFLNLEVNPFKTVVKLEMVRPSEAVSRVILDVREISFSTGSGEKMVIHRVSDSFGVGAIIASGQNCFNE